MGSFYEFFAGGGMARAGLGQGWRCLFANDFDPKKGSTYRDNWGTGGEFHVGDVREIKVAALPGQPDLIWGSFPCQDLSLAGNGAGLDGERSGTFFPFWKLIGALRAEGRAPKIVAVENVCGALTSHGGKDFETICQTFADAGYSYGALVINADQFVPQSRPRLFVVGVRHDVEIPHSVFTEAPEGLFHTKALRRAVDALPEKLREKLVWWRLAIPERREKAFAELIDDEPEGVEWHTQAETKKLLDMMSKVNLQKVEDAKAMKRRIVGGIYRRTRLDEHGRKVQRAEVRFDDIAGCLRTPAGGSSRQVIVLVEGYRVRTRLISARETARLMGLEDDYKLPPRYNDAYHLTGDGVVVPVVRHLAEHLFEPIININTREERVAA